jgi:hypothetical protein
MAMIYAIVNISGASKNPSRPIALALLTLNFGEVWV